MNGEYFSGITDYPKLVHGDIEDADIEKMAAFIKDMTGIGILVPDDALEDHVRRIGRLPERTGDSHQMDQGRKEQQERNEPPEPKTAAGKDSEEGSEEIPDKEAKEAEQAKERLGRGG